MCAQVQSSSGNIAESALRRAKLDRLRRVVVRGAEYGSVFDFSFENTFWVVHADAQCARALFHDTMADVISSGCGNDDVDTHPTSEIEVIHANVLSGRGVSCKFGPAWGAGLVRDFYAAARA